jgi:hypothetical protein
MTNNKAREINSPLIKQLIYETTPEELAKIDAEMTNNKQQTAVEWFAVEIYHEMSMTGSGRLLQDILDEAKAMHRKEQGKTWDAAIDNFKARGENYVRAYGDFDDYYNETY